MKTRFLVAIAVLVMTFACGTKSTEQTAADGFENFAKQFPALTLPLTIDEQHELKHQSTSISTGEATAYLNLPEVEGLYPVGSLSGRDYTSLLYYVDDEMDEAVVAVFYDKSWKQQGTLTVYRSTNEVKDHYAFVQKTEWTENTIKRKIEYHYGNDPDTSYSVEVITAINENGSLKSTPEVITPESQPSENEPAYAAEIFEYRSESFKNYQLYAVYLFEDAPQFVVVRNDEARLLTLDESREVEEGQAVDDEEFTAAKFLEEAEAEGITTFNQIELTTRADVNVVFNRSHTKRALTIGQQYSYASEAGSGSFAITPQGDEYIVAIETNVGDHFCELEGRIRIKGNIGYFQGQLYAERCKLIFLFTNDSVEILSVSSNSDCGCGANASLNHTFTLR